jgi:peptidoglycan/xylan/chitin deacetylase (PgdA/CDA1 family)
MNCKQIGMTRLVACAIALGVMLSACGEAARTLGIEAPPGAAAGRARDQRPPKPKPAVEDRAGPVPPATPAPAPAPDPSPTPPVEPPPPVGGDVPASLLGTQWYTLPTSEKVVALTFDAGANADAVPSILATLAAADVPATFFLTGNWVEAYPEYAAQIGVDYPVANHSNSHPDLTLLSDDEVTAEISDANDRIERVTGQDTHPMFRLPFGASDARTVGIANSLGYGCINWTVDTRGWQGTSGGQSVDLIVDRVIGSLQPGQIVIMHVGSHPTDGSTLDAEALPRVIEEIQARGYRFVTIDQYL